ncbi:hypothetical protein KEM52_006166 [Ascosphaera acerosa]|nr:hypothetical protein KEM52_006166 [Ascosphaera acerosa]
MSTTTGSMNLFSKMNNDQGPPAAPKNEPGAQGKASLATASGGLEARPSQAKFHFCPADALILALGLIVFSLQAHASLHLHSVTKPMMLMICMAVAVVFALAHNLITCRVIRVRAVFARFTVRAVCVLTSFAATLVATILETLYPYGGDTELSSCPGIGTTGDGATSTSSISPSQLCAELQASHILSYFLLSTEAIAAFLIVTHWFNVREMRSDGLPLSLGELLRMTEKEVDQALETLRIGGQLRDSETKRRALATRLDFISEYSV